MGEGGSLSMQQSTTTITDNHDNDSMTMMDEEEGQNWTSWE
jgi:hypothetical protein